MFESWIEKGTKMMHAIFKIVYIVFPLLFCLVEANHFRGGTISWQPTGNGYEVKENLKIIYPYRASIIYDKILSPKLSTYSVKRKQFCKIKICFRYSFLLNWVGHTVQDPDVPRHWSDPWSRVWVPPTGSVRLVAQQLKISTTSTTSVQGRAAQKTGNKGKEHLTMYFQEKGHMLLSMFCLHPRV